MPRLMYGPPQAFTLDGAWIRAPSPSSVVGNRPASTSKESSAVSRLAMSVLAAALRAISDLLVNFGTTTAARIARITSTSSSSMSVKPVRSRGRRRSCRYAVFMVLILLSRSFTHHSLLDHVLEVEHGQQHPDDDRPDDRSHHEQQRRLRQRHQHAELPVQVRLVGGGEAHQLLVEAAGLLGD